MQSILNQEKKGTFYIRSKERVNMIAFLLEGGRYEAQKWKKLVQWKVLVTSI